MTDDPMGKANDAADEAINAAVSEARNMKDDASDVAANFQTAVNRSVRDQPLTTLGMAIVAGFVFGAIWKA